MGNERPQVFHGWWVALAAALGLFLNTATIVVFSFGFFAKALMQAEPPSPHELCLLSKELSRAR
jgi:hypothetical protein